MSDNSSLIESLTKSKIYRDYQRAFSDATGLPVSLRSVESWQLPHHGQRHENRFCGLMAERSRACSACLQVQQKLSETATHQAQCVTCPVGLTDLAVPVRMGEQLVGFLQTGQYFRKAPTAAQFDRAAALAAEWGVPADRHQLKDAYFRGAVLDPAQHTAVTSLLSIFAQHLSLVSNQIAIQQENTEPPVITRAKQFMREHMTEDLSLEIVAKAVHTSTFYFCKLFKKATGINFTDFLARTRIEHARNLLLNPNLRVSEIAYEVGFQSLTHFNRVFKRIVGRSPTNYRAQLARA
jgi:AraC-like DNA-binding protein/ligand-binding sensor protein